MPNPSRRQPSELDREILRLLRTRNEEGLILLLREYGARVKRLVARRTGTSLDDSDLDEALNDAACQVWHNYAQYDPRHGLDTWFLSMTYYAALKIPRRTRRYSSGQEDMEALIDRTENPDELPGLSEHARRASRRWGLLPAGPSTSPSSPSAPLRESPQAEGSLEGPDSRPFRDNGIRNGNGNGNGALNGNGNVHGNGVHGDGNGVRHGEPPANGDTENLGEGAGSCDRAILQPKGPPAEPEPETRDDFSELHLALHRSMQRLQPQERKVMLADLACDGLADADLLAIELDTKRETIYVARSQGRKRLRAYLAEEGFHLAPKGRQAQGEHR